MRTKWKAVVALLALLAGTAFAETYTREVEDVFVISEGQTVRLATLGGAVSLVRSPSRELVVEAVKKVESDDADEAAEILDNIRVEMQQDPSGVAIEAAGPEGGKARIGRWGWKTPSWAVDFRVAVPADCPVSVACTSGDVTADGLVGRLAIVCTSGDVAVSALTGGNVALSTTSGDIQASDIDADLSVAATSGDVEVSGVTGRAVLEAVSGDVSVEALGSEASVTTVGGDVSLRLVGECPTAEVSTTSGDVQVTVLPDVSAAVFLKAQSGDVDCSVGERGSVQEEGRWEGIIGDGCGSIRVTTVGGDIEVGRGGV